MNFFVVNLRNLRKKGEKRLALVDIGFYLEYNKAVKSRFETYRGKNVRRIFAYSSPEYALSVDKEL